MRHVVTDLRMLGNGLSAERPARLVLRAEYEDGGAEEIAWVKPDSVRPGPAKYERSGQMAMHLEIAGSFTVDLHAAESECRT
jgi:hypothetical protein